ncbi:radical SAM family heme chaperone HemW [Trinickia caryophylli]|uniref:Heme chaperone HemW n=1 Tax=Trinickia caryophylli TaxID=28094 RepID=A0A1X7CLS7_TRICW|nr:radical SAM family heme chaperone HemW [Trinickia caryophylli]PMS09058.1 oxygen-independent coproporphyrinogen III oxidase-like protein [Trinickia caryophylli]TRX20009.1 oxygen-independent coproporphyrinogen III oxidase-like protein [Trinickia caryophylli]WQE12646.1 radical SAM family heme chaperone HemW [Trinickia caryophylli]SME98458.1 oxygen-independent coproporphyrinogen-3 oxidase [Trinickia caryophylli]GLU30348.1 coproporphyrinogen III oxidase [Trinickia caryophylli]
MISPVNPTRDGVVSAFLAPGKINLASLPPLALYVHFPWCVRKCPYCDFNSHEWKGERFPEDDYLDALRADLEQALPLVWGRQVHTIFIGGGTPSLLSARGLDRLLSDVRALLPLDAGAEITMEANPGTFEADKFAQFRASGVNRLSVGIQSFDERHLKALGRIHGGTDARRAVEIAAQHFDNFNLDLMFALPQQTLEECRADIETALGFAPPHLSLYHLTLEPNTLFAKYPPALPDDDASADMQDWIHERMAGAGYDHYEVSAYAKPQRQCKHNLNYWRFGDYLGIGAGAHSKISFAHRIVRQMRYKHPGTFMEKARAGMPVQDEHEVGTRDLPFEFMLNALRLDEGFPVHRFVERTGLTMTSIEPALREAEQRGLIARDHERIVTTPLGQRFLNDLQALFLGDKAQ